MDRQVKPGVGKSLERLEILSHDARLTAIEYGTALCVSFLCGKSWLLNRFHDQVVGCFSRLLKFFSL
jgi:hypothetical protein